MEMSGEVVKDIPGMPLVEELHVMFASRRREVPGLHLGCSQMPRLKTLKIDNCHVRWFVAFLELLSTDQTKIRGLQLWRCWCSYDLLASLPPSLLTT